MAQEGQWSVRRPRETLGPIGFNSGIPQPPSTMKRSSFNVGSAHGRSVSGSRHSLALGGRPSQPLFARSSSGANIADMASVKRTSIQNSGNNTMLLKAYGQTPATDADRRSSAYAQRRSTMGGPITGTSAHQSFFQQLPPPAGVPRDPRPLKDRAFQARMGQELAEFLTKGNFELETNHQLSQNFLKSPTQKDFNFMFQWLYRRIDPSHRFQKSIDQEVPPLLKQLRYPYERGITKSQIAAVGGQNWSTFLGVLHWMMQLAQMLERYSTNQYDDACAEAGVDVTGDHICFDFLSATYNEFMSADPATSEEEAAARVAPYVHSMAGSFERANAKYVQELDFLEAENARLVQEMQDLNKSTPDPAVLDKHFKIMEEDKVKFEEYNQVAQQRADKYEARIQVLQEELEKAVTELREADEERRSLQKAVDDLGISMQDIDRMTSERERLQKGIEAAAARLDDVKRRVADKEAEAGAKLDELERMVDKYNTLAYQIGLIPATAVNAKGRDYELQITVNEGIGAAGFASSQLGSSLQNGRSPPEQSDRLLADAVTGYQPAHVLNLDLRGQVKNSFLALRKEISERRKVVMDAMIEEHDLLESAKEAIEDKRSEVEALEHRVRAAEEEYEKTKEVTTAQKLGSDAQIEKTEKELAKMRAQLSESVQLLEQREMNVNIEYEQLTLRANALREQLHTETERILQDTIKFKIHIQKALEEYEEFVADEVELELANEDGMGDDSQMMD